jgi:hypothetical protein
MEKGKIYALVAGLLLAGTAHPTGAAAQSLSYGKAAAEPDSAAVASDDDSAALPTSARKRGRGGARGGGHGGGRAWVSPYIEASQVIGAELAPTHDVLTWSTVAVGVDGGLGGRNTRGTFSLRYERRFGYGKRAEDGDVLSGLARVEASVVPQAVMLEAGALATRTTTFGTSAPGSADPNRSTRLWSAYAGPSTAA